MILKTEGIVLKHFDFRETSRIATFFTKDYGKIKGVLKGIRKDHKKFGSSIDKFSLNDIVYYQYRNSEIHLISQCDLRNFFFDIRKDLKRSLAAHYLLELVDKIMPQEDPNDDVYSLMMDFLSSLGEEADTDKLVHILQIKMLLYSGFRPYIDSCIKCNAKVKTRAKFSNNLGGLVCEKCKISDETITVINGGTVATILFAEQNPWEKCLRLTLSPLIKKELKYILNNFLVFHLGKKIQSAKFVQQ
ncbi:MAG: DNA repair protein RecO [Omnitrophica WOR_2 bacterium GWA2_47_8]|nr:MAG: DNA repair protein RecO [Omnitrophica WOR_2 bacterium GWA2_47_8]